MRPTRRFGFQCACVLSLAVLLAGLLDPTDSLARQQAESDSMQTATRGPTSKNPGESRPVRLPMQALNTDLSMAMSRAPGVFAYSFDASGWPNGLSAWGGNPNHTTLVWDDRPVNDLLVGRPGFDMVPIALLASASWSGDGSVDVRSDPLQTLSPVTRVRYESAGDGLQSVQALHVQNRNFRTGDSTSVRMQTVFGYAGGGAQGEYDGSRLRRAREITARVGMSGQKWSAWIQDVASRRAVGAHAGVEPFTANYESIYQRLGAVVTDPTARRRTIRNDLELGGNSSMRGWLGTLRMVRTSQTLDFDGSTFSSRGWTTRWQLLTSLASDAGPGRLHLDGQLLRDAGFGGSAWTAAPGHRTFTAVTASFHVKQAWSVEAGVRKDAHHTWWHAVASGSRRQGPVHVNGLVTRSARRLTLMETAGFGEGIPGLSTLTDVPLQDFLLARAGAEINTGLWTISLDGSFRREQDAVVHQLGSSHPDLDSAVMSGARSRATASVSLGWRDDGRHGMYARTGATRTFSASPDETPLSSLWESSMPRQWASARLGWRALLFERDLDLDLFIRARIWDDANGLRLHTPTGLLVLPEDASTPVEGNWLVDVVAEGDVRGATLFFAYENVFSGTSWQAGNLIVPDYPLPRQRIRFGVYWPIAN